MLASLSRAARNNRFWVFVHAVHPILARYETNIAVRTNQKNDVVFIRNAIGSVHTAIEVDNNSCTKHFCRTSTAVYSKSPMAATDGAPNAGNVKCPCETRVHIVRREHQAYFGTRNRVLMSR